MSQIHDNPPSDTPEPEAAGLTAKPQRIRTSISGEKVLETVRGMSKKGKLAGFAAGGANGASFSADAHGKPFDSTLQFRITSEAEGEHEGEWCVIDTGVRLKRTLPTVFAVVAALSIWPGVLLTDSLMNTWFGWYPNEMWVTYAWYMPLTILPLPWMVRKAIRQSQASALEHASETIEKIAKAVGGTVVESE